MLPWVVPFLTGFQSHSKLLQHTLCFLSFKKFKCQLVIYGFSGSFFTLLARSSCFTESKALLMSISKRQTRTVSTFSVGELWGDEVAFNGLAGIAVVHNFLKSPRFYRSYITAVIITMCFRNIHFVDGVMITCFHDDGKHWVEIERLQLLVIGGMKISACSFQTQ